MPSEESKLEDLTVYFWSVRDLVEFTTWLHAQEGRSPNSKRSINSSKDNFTRQESLIYYT